MKKYGDFIQINETNTNNISDASNYLDLFTRVETNHSDTYIYTGDIKERKILKKGYITKYNFYYGWNAYTSINYNNKPVLKILALHNDHTTETGIDTLEKFYLYTKIVFNNDLNKAIDFFNKRFLSALKLELNKETLLLNFEEYKDVKIETLISNNPIKKTSTFTYFTDLDFVKSRTPNPKSKTEMNLIDSSNLIINGINKYASEQFNIPIDKLSSVDSFIVCSIPKKSNPIRIRLGLRRDHFTDNRNHILKIEFFNKYKKYFDLINKMYKEFDEISIKSYWHDESAFTDSMSFIIDVTKIDKESEFIKKIISYSNISKFKLF